ncbi:hypothetical protein BBJ29_007279 [Phytophthora kernoviae]|uniref:glucan endo-1,3-beta-D-glucosidase n=1 Tax=Phytophthora kernoviae TaxID=325452 RepID=A0A3F2RVT8_9STRA|nr:hypothetical protein BBP00_00003482 [Phytophthora kernoviae]RLN70985.1 hypothetical protein BBJ29_007279 [Phytophthora kernoviae]
MKFFVPTVAGVIAFSAQVNANGVCYDPNHGTGMTASSVAADMEIIAGKGFDSVRTYISKFGDVELGPIIAAAGLKVMLGVPYPQSDYQDQMAAAIKAAQSGGVSAIMVGNENLAGSCSPPSDMISVIQSIKSQVPGGVLVGSVQRNTEGIQCPGQSGWDELVSACDILGINAQPFFNPGTTALDAINVLNSHGMLSGNVGSTEGAEIFYNAYQQWGGSISQKYYFQIFDTPYRTEPYEQTFGLMTSDGQDKFTLSVTQSTTVQLTQTEGSNEQQQQQTPEATTAAPIPDATTAAPLPEATTAAPAPEGTPAPEATTGAPTPETTPAVYQSTGSGVTQNESGSATQETPSTPSTPSTPTEPRSNCDM